MDKNKDKLQIGWKLVKEYPFQKIGDIIEIPITNEKSYKFKNTNITIDKRLLDSPLFEPYYFESNIGDTVLYKNWKDIRSGIITKIEDETVFLKFNNGKPKTEKVNFRKISKCISYWYFNSFLQPCQIIVASNVKLEEMQKRINLCNYFETKEECQNFIIKIKEILKP